MDQLRARYIQLEKTMQAKERNYKQRIVGLEQQVGYVSAGDCFCRPASVRFIVFASLNAHIDSFIYCVLMCVRKF